ncbi:alpha/beta hydrolase family protein [Patescibacteria group bacterium]
MKTENTYVANRFGEKLEILLRKPNEEGKYPAVIFVSGFGMGLHEYKNSNDEISQFLVKEGFVTVQFSFSGCGNSGGDYKDMTLERQAIQVEDVIKWLSKEKYVNQNRIGVFAQSFGVPSLLSANISKISCLCLNAGTYNPLKSLKKVFVEERSVKIEDDEDVIIPRSDGTIIVVGKQFFPELEKFDINKHLDNINQPVLLIHGTNDTKVTTDEVKNVFIQIKSKQKILKIFEGGDHGISDVPGKMRKEFLQSVIEWFKETL